MRSSSAEPSRNAALIGVASQRITGDRVGHLPIGVFNETQLEGHFADTCREVARAGGIPVYLSRESDPREVVARLDGMVLTGGDDVDPRAYGRLPGPNASAIDPGRDRFEMALLHNAIAAGIPVLGICRGCQLINVALGGTLVAHLPPDDGEGHSFLRYPRGHRSHEVTLEQGSRLRDMYGAVAAVNSFHHQAVQEPGDRVRVVAWAADGVAEAIEVEGVDVIGVQWHPEWLHSEPVFAWLVSRALGTSFADSSSYGVCEKA